MSLNNSKPKPTFLLCSLRKELLLSTKERCLLCCSIELHKKQVHYISAFVAFKKPNDILLY